MSSSVLVTGANQGIGFAIVRTLCQRKCFDSVVLAARNPSNGEKALSQLKEEGFDQVSLLLLDIDDEKSVARAAEEVAKTFGSIDVLINNAGMAFKGSAFDETVSQTTQHTNYIGTKLMCQTFIPLMKKNGRIINVSSMAANGALRKMSKELQAKFLAPDLSTQQLDALMLSFTDSVRRKAWKQEGWPDSCYGVSKVGVSMLTRLLAAANPHLIINACCPGWVRTAMAGPKAPKSPEEGADTPVFLATSEGSAIGSGGMWSERKIIGWGA